MSSKHIDDLEDLKQLIYNGRINILEAYSRLQDIINRTNKYIKVDSLRIIEGYDIVNDSLYRFNGDTNVKVKTKRLLSDIDRVINIVIDYTMS